MEAYKSSAFFAKYQDSYFSDAILKDVFHCKKRKRSIRLADYEAVYRADLEMMRDFLVFASQTDCADEETKWAMLKSAYLDPDGWSVRRVGEVACSADGLISLTRLYRIFGLTEKLPEEYKKYRAFPIIHFPAERNGINMSRAAIFGDRIDHTLFDLKRYCEGGKDCRLSSAYQRENTRKWLQQFRSFGEIADWLGVRWLFVNESLDVFDLEKNDGTVICRYRDAYPWEWSKAYYDHLTAKITSYGRNKE